MAKPATQAAATPIKHPDAWRFEPPPAMAGDIDLVDAQGNTVALIPIYNNTAAARAAAIAIAERIVADHNGQGALAAEARAREAEARAADLGRTVERQRRIAEGHVKAFFEIRERIDAALEPAKE